MLRKFAWLAVGCWFGIVPTVGSAALTLVEDGKVHSVVCVHPRVMAPDLTGSDKPTTEPEREAESQRVRLRESVKDLAHYLGKVSGATFEVVNVKSGDAALKAHPGAILIGELAEEVFGKPATTAPFKQGFRYVVDERGVGLLGESDLATSYAIYELLDRLGCRWFMPGPMGECIPSLKTIALDEVDFSSAPYTHYRGIWYADDAYRRRNRHGGLLLSAGHALENSHVTAEDREAHPEWRATIDGKPHKHRLKWSNVELAHHIADKIIADYEKTRQPSYSLSPDDGLGYDNSPEDRALDAGDFDPTIGEISITDRLMVLCNRIAERVTAKHPDVLFGMLAYANYTRPPVRESVHPNIVPQIAPITYARAHPMDMDEVPGNKDVRYIVEGWAERCAMTSYYFYGWFLAEPVAPNPMLTKWGRDIPYVFEKGKCRFWQPETTANFETSMHALYLGCRLAWDPTLKPEDVFHEINTRFYGNAAEPMAAYWQFIDDVWVNTPEYSGCGFAYLRRWTPENLRTARQYMNEALAAATTPEEKFRVGMANDSLTLFEQFMKLRLDQAEGRFENLDTEAQAWLDRIIALAEQYREYYAFGRMTWTKYTIGGAYFRSFYQKTYDDAARVAREFTILTQPPLRQWKYQADENKSGEAAGWAAKDFDDSAWKTTDVAVETWSTLGYHDYFKSMWYRAPVKLDPIPAGKKVYLWLGATDGSAKVFINGRHVPFVTADGKTQDEFNGYAAPASFDITAALDPSGDNRIAILCTRTFLNELGTGGLLAPVVVYREKD